MRLAVTTPLRPSPAEEAEARAAAVRHGLPFVARGRRAAAEALARGAAPRRCSSSPRAPSVLAVGGEEWRWSPGMGALRAKRLRARAGARGDPSARDPFLDAAGLREGDEVLDCTVGLGADALVAAAAAGPRGRVVGLEASAPLAAWVAEGLRRLDDPAARRIEIRAADHAEALAALPDRSFDVVLFDPMFRHARAEPARLRRRAPARRPAAALARRRSPARAAVARRWVVVKDGAPGWDLARLGLVPLPSARGAHRYYARVAAG